MKTKNKKKSDKEVITQNGAKGKLHEKKTTNTLCEDSLPFSEDGDSLKTRDDFKKVFIKGYAPTQKDFEDLFNSYLNLEDDGIESSNSDKAISLVAKSDGSDIKELLNFKSFNNDRIAWSLGIDSDDSLCVSYHNSSDNVKKTVLKLLVDSGTISFSSNVKFCGDITVDGFGKFNKNINAEEDSIFKNNITVKDLLFQADGESKKNS